MKLSQELPLGSFSRVSFFARANPGHFSSISLLPPEYRSLHFSVLHSTAMDYKIV
jgi:hypothetical protein